MLRTPKITPESGLALSLNARYYGGTNLPLGSIWPGGPLASNNSPYYSKTEYMDDVVTRGRKAHGMQPCVHIKILRKRLNSQMGNGGFHYCTWYNSLDHNAGYWAFDDPAADDLWNNWLDPWSAQPAGTVGSQIGPATTPNVGLPAVYILAGTGQQKAALQQSVIDEFVSVAFKGMLPGIVPSGGISLVNSIIELKDFHSLPRTVQRLKGVIPLVGRLFKSSYSKKKTLRQLLRAGADSYLQAQFNILPLLSDIANTNSAIRSAMMQLKELQKRAGQPQKRHFRRILGQYADEHKTCTYNTNSYVKGTKLTYGRHVTYTDRLLSATLEYSYSLPSMPDELARLGAYLDALGVNLNPRIIWNAIPWSFVIDWVVNVNSWLDNWRSRNIEPVVDIHGACYSISVARVISTFAGIDGAADPCVELYEEVYDRRLLDRSALYAQITTSGLNLKEFSLGAALALTR